MSLDLKVNDHRNFTSALSSRNLRDAYNRSHNMGECFTEKVCALSCDEYWNQSILQDIKAINLRVKTVALLAETKAHLHNVVVFLRMHEAVIGGVTALATQHVELCTKYVT